MRAGRVIYVNDATLELIQRSRDEVVGHPFTSFLPPQEAARLFERYERRQRAEPVPSVYESAVLTRDGATRAVEIAASFEEDRTLVQFRDITASVERRRKLRAVAQLGVAVLYERNEQAIFRCVYQGLAELGLAVALAEPDGELLRVVATHAPDAVRQLLQDALAGHFVGVSRPWSAAMQVAWREGASYHDDAALELAEFVGGDPGAEVRRVAVGAKLVRAAALRVDVGAAPVRLLLVLGTWLREEDLPVLRLFASQISAALDAAQSIARLSRRNEALAAVNRLAELASTAVDLPTLFRSGCEEICRVAGCEAVAIYIVDATGRAADLVHQHGGSQEAGRLFARSPIDSPATLLWRVAHGGEAQVWTRDDYPEPARSVVARMGQEVIASIPLVARSKVVGVMNLAYHTKKTLDAAEIDLFKAMGAHFAAAVEEQRLLDDLRGRVADLRLLHELGRSLVATLEPRQVLDLGVKSLAQSVGASDAYLLLEDPATRRLVIRAEAGTHPELLGESLPVDPPGSVAAAAFIEGAPVVIEDSATDPRVDKALRRATGASAYLALPLIVRDRVIGSVVIGVRGGPRRFGLAEIERAAGIANQIAVAVENARLYDDLRASYEQLAQAQEQLVERERLAALGQLAAVVAHEVRNPLGAIFNSLGTLERILQVEGDAATLLGIVGQEARRLNRIVGDLLDFARPRAPALRPIVLGEVLDEAVHAALGDAGPELRVERALDADLPRVLADEHFLRQAIINLVLNALQAMPQGGTLTLRAHVGQRASGDVVCVEICDTGPGLDDETKARIFEPFFTTKAAGTGLGLALVRRIVESHQGDIEVVSEQGRGTTFRLCLPLAAS